VEPFRVASEHEGSKGPWTENWPERRLEDGPRRRLEQRLLGESPVPDGRPRELDEIETELAEQRRRLAALERGLVPPAERQQAARAHLLFVPAPSGYGLIEREGALPPLGGELVTDEGRFFVSRIGRSPLPLDGRPCAYVQRVG
jgi:hypothetical protein